MSRGQEIRYRQIAILTSAGMGQQEIATALGCSRLTVARALRHPTSQQILNVPDSTFAERAIAPLLAHVETLGAQRLAAWREREAAKQARKEQARQQRLNAREGNSHE